MGKVIALPGLIMDKGNPLFPDRGIPLHCRAGSPGWGWRFGQNRLKTDPIKVILYYIDP